MLAEDVRKKIRRIEIVTGKLVEEVFAGKYESLFKGRGVEFAEVREYQPGDDIRTIDWNLTARFGKPFVKKLEEERELTVILAVDASGSGEFGSGDISKRELASEIGAILALSAMRNSDKVGMLLFTDRVEKYIPPRKGRQHGLRLIREILQPEPRGRGTDVAGALDYLNRVLRRRAVVFLLSDFLSDAFEKPLKLAVQKHDVSAFRLQDPREEDIPRMGRVRLRDLETGRLLLLDTSSAEFQRRYQEAVGRRRAEMRRMFERAGADYEEFSTAEPVVPALVRFFAMKAARRRRVRRSA